MVLHTSVTSTIDYCNGLLYGLLDCEIAKLQRVQNAAARLLMSSKKYDHITPILINLHWLPVRYRINFKILLLAFKALYGMTPSCLSSSDFDSSCLVFSSSLDFKFVLNIEKTSLTIGNSSRSKDLGMPLFPSAASLGVGILDEILNVRSRKQF